MSKRRLVSFTYFFSPVVLQQRNRPCTQMYTCARYYFNKNIFPKGQQNKTMIYVLSCAHYTHARSYVIQFGCGGHVILYPERQTLVARTTIILIIPLIVPPPTPPFLCPLRFFIHILIAGSPVRLRARFLHVIILLYRILHVDDFLFFFLLRSRYIVIPSSARDYCNNSCLYKSTHLHHHHHHYTTTDYNNRQLQKTACVCLCVQSRTTDKLAHGNESRTRQKIMKGDKK